MLSNLPKVIQLVGNRARIHTPGLRSQLVVIIPSAVYAQTFPNLSHPTSHY